MPTISPFRLDGINTKSLSSFDIKGKRWTKIFSFLDKHSAVYTPLEYLLKSLNELPLFVSQGVPIYPCSLWVDAKLSSLLKCVVHAPLDCKQGLQKNVLQEEHDSIINELPITKGSYIHPSPNPVGIYQYWLIHATKWGYARYQMIIHDWNITSSFPWIVGVQFTSYDQNGFIKWL